MNFAKENPKAKPIQLIKMYNKEFPELSAKEKLINLSKALGINSLHKSITGKDIPKNERLANES